MGTHDYLMSLSKDELIELLFLSEDLDNWDNEKLLNVINFDYSIFYPNNKAMVIDIERMGSLNAKIGQVLLSKFIEDYQNS